ncbi:hypothetical protein BKA93DRAFT_599578 [Sparassis latifolia]
MSLCLFFAHSLSVGFLLSYHVRSAILMIRSSYASITCARSEHRELGGVVGCGAICLTLCGTPMETTCVQLYSVSTSNLHVCAPRLGRPFFLSRIDVQNLESAITLSHILGSCQ